MVALSMYYIYIDESKCLGVAIQLIVVKVKSVDRICIPMECHI